MFEYRVERIDGRWLNVGIASDNAVVAGINTLAGGQLEESGTTNAG